MKVLAVQPGPLMYTKIYLRLEPLGLELVAEAVRRAGHSVRLLDLQIEDQRDYMRLLQEWAPDAVLFSCNYMANVHEIVDLAKLSKTARPSTFIVVGGHSASFVAADFLAHGEGAIDCVLKGLAGAQGHGQDCGKPSPSRADEFCEDALEVHSVYNPELQLADHRRPALYEMTPPRPVRHTIDAKALFILPAKGRQGRAIDDDTERFVDVTRTSTAA